MFAGGERIKTAPPGMVDVDYPFAAVWIAKKRLKNTNSALLT